MSKNEHDEMAYSENMERCETALSHNSVSWIFVVTCQIKCLTFRLRSRSKVTLNFGVIKKITAIPHDPVTFWGHKLGQTDRKGHHDLSRHNVGHVNL